MTGLLRTELSTPLKAELAASAFALQGIHGAMSDLGTDFDISRPTVYAAASVAEGVLNDHFQRAQEKDPVVLIRVDLAQLKRTVVAMRIVGPNSIRDIEELLPIIYPGIKRSFGSIQGFCAEAQARAGDHNLCVDFSAITAAALDEFYSQPEHNTCACTSGLSRLSCTAHPLASRLQDRHERVSQLRRSGSPDQHDHQTRGGGAGAGCLA